VSWNKLKPRDERRELPIMSNKLGVVTGVAQLDTVDADCIAVSCVAGMTPDNSIA